MSVVKDILLSSVFIFPTMAMFFIYGVVSSILLSCPYIFIREYNMQVADFGWVIGLTILCLLISSILNARLLKKFKAYGITKVSLFVMLLSMLGVTLSDLTSTYIADLIALACFWLVFLCVYPNLLMMACAHFPQYKGTAIAMFSF